MQLLNLQHDETIKLYRENGKFNFTKLEYFLMKFLPQFQNFCSSLMVLT